MGNKPFAMGNTDADDGTQGQGGPSKLGKRSCAGYLQALIDSEPNNKFYSRGRSCSVGGFDGAVDSPPHIPAHLPKLELNELSLQQLSSNITAIAARCLLKMETCHQSVPPEFCPSQAACQYQNRMQGKQLGCRK